MPLGEIDHSKEQVKEIVALYAREDLADITIKVEGESFRAHRLILSTRSSYFKELLYDGQWKREITLSNIAAPVFQIILEYFYTGRLSLKSTVENFASKVMDLAKRFKLQLLQRDVVDDTCAYLLSEEPMTDELADFLDKEADTVITTDMFATLPQGRVVELLTRDTFCVKNEIDIFRAAVRWSKGRPQEECNKVLGAVRLSLIQPMDLLDEVRNSGVVRKDDILDAMDKQMKNNVIDPRRSKEQNTVDASTDDIAKQVAPVIVSNANLATMDRGASVIAGCHPKECILDDEHDYSRTTRYLCHSIGEQEGIQVQLDKVYSINTVNLHMQDKDRRLVSYYIEVSTERDGPWTRVIDYTAYQCRGRQLLHFRSTPVRYLKVVGTACSVGGTFDLISLECSYTENPLSMTQDLLEPVENQALEAAGALLMERNNCTVGKSMLDGIHTDNDGYTHCWWGGSIKVCLPQPVWLGSLRCRLGERKPCRFTVDVSVDNETWTRVADKSNEDCKSWQNFSFNKQPVSFIAFSSTRYSPLSVQYLECPDKGTK